MPNPTIYTTGTVSVTAGATAVTGVGTVWSGLVKPGSHITIGGSMGIVASVSSDTALTLASVWAGSNQSGQPYAIAIPPGDASELAMKGRALIEAVTARGVAPINAVLLKGGPTNSPPGSPTTGDRYIVGTSPTGAWSGQAGKYAEWSGSAWTFTSPVAPAYSVVASTGAVYVWDGLAWSVVGGSAGTNLTFTRNSTTVTVLSDTGADAVLPGASGTDAGVMLAADKSKLDGINTALGTKARITADVGPIANTETVVVSHSIPANTLAVGTTFKIKAGGLHTNTTTATSGSYRVRMGATTLTGGTVAGTNFPYGGTARTNSAFDVEFIVTIRSIGASGTAYGYATTAQSIAANQTALVTAPVTIDTTGTLLIELTYQSGGATTTETFVGAVIEQVS